MLRGKVAYTLASLLVTGVFFATTVLAVWAYWSGSRVLHGSAWIGLVLVGTMLLWTSIVIVKEPSGSWMPPERDASSVPVIAIDEDETEPLGLDNANAVAIVGLRDNPVVFVNPKPWQADWNLTFAWLASCLIASLLGVMLYAMGFQRFFWIATTALACASMIVSLAAMFQSPELRAIMSMVLPASLPQQGLLTLPAVTVRPHYEIRVISHWCSVLSLSATCGVWCLTCLCANLVALGLSARGAPRISTRI